MQFKSVALALVVTPATQAAAHSVSAPEDLVGTAVAAGTFNALAAALTAAGLIETL